MNHDPNAMSLATADKKWIALRQDGFAQGLRYNGFVFYTNLENAKRTVYYNPTCFCFHWKALKASKDRGASFSS